MELNKLKLYSAISDRLVADYEEQQQQQNHQLHQQQLHRQKQQPGIASKIITKQMRQTTPFGSTSLKPLNFFSSITLLPTTSPPASSILLSPSPSAPKSSNSSSVISARGLLMLLLLLTSPVTSLDLPVDHTSHAIGTTVSVAVSCHRYFNRRVQECLDPFTSLLAVYDRHKDKLIGDEASSKHICLEYKMVLLCLHSALTDCPTLHYVKRVQRKLSSHWVIRVNKLCAIQSNQAEQRVSRQYDSSDSKSWIPAHPYSEYSSQDFGSQSLTNRRVVYKSNRNKSAFMRNTVDTGNSEYRNRYFSTSRKDIDFHHDSPEDDHSSGHTGGSEIVIKLVKLVQNFNYKTRTENGERATSTEHSSQTISNNSAFRNDPSLQLWILYVAAIILALHLQLTCI